MINLHERFLLLQTTINGQYTSHVTINLRVTNSRVVIVYCVRRLSVLIIELHEDTI